MNWQLKHGAAIDAFLEFMNSRTDRFILKGGTAFAKCYGLDRFSEDIDLDAGKSDISSQIIQFCKVNNYTYREQKKTNFVQRFFVNYGQTETPLKIEVSTRRKIIPEDEVTTINGIRVYNLDSLTILKAAAFRDRDKIRDLYDLVFVVNNHFDKLSPATKLLITSEFEHKGIEQFDYLINTQNDRLIDNNRFAIDVLAAFDKLDLLYSKDEEEQLRFS